MKITEKELQRLQKLTEIDRTYWDQGLVLAGMDEVGRGPLAGPVVVGCVVMPPAPSVASPRRFLRSACPSPTCSSTPSGVSTSPPGSIL